MFHNYSHFKQCYGKSKFRASFVARKAVNRECRAARLLFVTPSRGSASQIPLARFVLPRNVTPGNLKQVNLQWASRRGMSLSLKPDGPKGGDPGDNSAVYKVVFLASALFFVYLLFRSSADPPQTISWQYFVQEVLPKGEIKQILVIEDKDLAFIITKDNTDPRSPHKVYLMNLPEGKTFEEDIRKEETRLGIEPRKGVIVYHHSNKFWKDIVHLLIGMLLFFLFKKGLNFSASDMNPFTNISRARFTLVDPLVGQGKGVKFSDVAGLQEAKQEIMEFVDYLKRPEHYNTLGARVPKGALLLGPPGCGKTLLAKAVATEANVPFLSMNGSEFIELIGGLGAARVRSLFSEARRRSPCIIYIDEIDTIGKKRATNSMVDGSQSEGEQTLNQLLVEMDGMASRDGVIMLASTNRSEILDGALLRPGRFDRHIMIDLPTLEERREIFVHHLKSIHLEFKPEFYARRMASLTPGFSGADIANICNEAALHAARYKKTMVTGEDLEYAVERVVGGIEKRSHAISPEEKRLVAYHEAGRALVGWLLETGEALLKISVVPRTRQTVGWTQFARPEQVLFSQKELFDKMCIALGGRAAELLMFNRTSTKAEKDLRKVTRIAYAQVRQYGMNSLVGLVSFGDVPEFRVKPYSRQLAALIDEEARKLVTLAHRQAESVLAANKDKLMKLADALLKHETLNYNDVVKLIGPPPKEKKKLVEPLEFDLDIDRAAGPEPTPQQQQQQHQNERSAGEAKNRGEDSINVSSDLNFGFA